MAETQQNQSKLPSTQPTLLTAEDLWKQPDDGYRYELVKGIMHKMPPAGFEHGIRSAKIARHLDAYVEKHKTSPPILQHLHCYRLPVYRHLTYGGGFARRCRVSLLLLFYCHRIRRVFFGSLRVQSLPLSYRLCR